MTEQPGDTAEPARPAGAEEPEPEWMEEITEKKTIKKTRRVVKARRPAPSADSEKRQLEIDAEPARARQRKKRTAWTIGGVAILGAEEFVTVLHGIVDAIVKLLCAF